MSGLRALSCLGGNCLRWGLGESIEEVNVAARFVLLALDRGSQGELSSLSLLPGTLDEGG